MNSDTTTCITCGTPLPGQMLSGKCPACLQRVALMEPTMPGDTLPESRMSRRSSGWEPPSAEEVAALLPRGFYSVESFIGRGGMGAVYKGTQTVLKRPVAIKIMRQDQAVDAEFRLRFLREAQMLARLSHPGIVNVIDCGEAGPDMLFIVMEFVDGANLMDVIRSGGVSEARALKIMKQVCEALQFAHIHGIVHRDIKPSNIILMRDGRIKLADFGLATQMEPEEGEESDTAHAAGTPAYAAPEQFAAGQSVDQRADIYSLGVMIYQMLTGELPRGDWKPPSQAVAIDPAWDKIISQALQPLPQDRLSAADAMQEMLSRISPLKDEQIRRRRTLPILSTVVLLMFFIIGWLLVKSGRDSDYPAPKTWVDAMPELQATAELYQFGRMKDSWLEIVEDAHADLAESREFNDVAMRVTYEGALQLGLRGTMDEYYFASVLSDGEAKIGIGTTNVVAHPDAKPSIINLGQTHDARVKHELVFSAQGDVMRMWLDGRLLLTRRDPILTSGRLCLRANPKPETPVRILQLEFAALGGVASPAPAPRREIKHEPGSIAHRLTSPDFKWAAPVNLGPEVNCDTEDADPHISPDGLILTYVSDRGGVRRFYECRRRSVNEPFRDPQRMNGVIATWAAAPWLTPDRRTLVFVGAGGPDNLGGTYQDLYTMKRPAPSGPWEQLVNLKTLNSVTHDQSPCLSSDGLTLHFGSLRGGGYGGHDRWIASRKSLDAPFGDVRNLGPTLNTFIQERDLYLAADDRTLLFVRQHNEESVSTSVLHLAVPDGTGGYQVEVLSLPAKGMITDPCVSSDGGTLWFAWKGPEGRGERDLWQIQRVSKDAPVSTVAHPELANLETPFENTLGMRFVPVPITGGPTDHQRLLFSIWETRVQDYAVFAKETTRVWPEPGYEQGPSHPAAMLSWHDAHDFCQWLTEREHKSGKLSAHLSYFLPTYHEWSCAMGIGEREDAEMPISKKGLGLNHLYPWGESWPPPQNVANFAGEEARSLIGDPQYLGISWVINGYRDPFVATAPVGSFPANANGLHDLSGNLWEWCADWSDEKQTTRVLRGHAFLANDGPGARMTTRGAIPPDGRQLVFGMRVVLAEKSARKVEESIPKPSPAQAPAPPPLPSVSRFDTPVAKATKEAPFVNSLGMKFAPVEVTLGPVAGRYVLYSVWETRMRDYEVFAMETKREWPKPDFPQGPDHPAVNLTWNDGVTFAEWLTARDRKASLLSTNESYRLPEDTEWSCAVGVGSLEYLGSSAAEKVMQHRDVFPWGKAWPPPADGGNYAGEECRTATGSPASSAITSVIEGYRDGFMHTAPVGSFAPNAIGLHDMGGNVQEWTLTWFDAPDSKRTVRGGSWQLGSRFGAHSFARAGIPPAERHSYQGLRVVLVTAYGSQREAPEDSKLPPPAPRP